MKRKQKEISIIVPCYNEEKNIDLFCKEIVKVFSKVIDDIELIFINDGSSDKTLINLIEVSNNYKISMKIVDFSRNFGKEAAMIAGLEHSSGKYTVIIDADLQQNPKYILEMKKILDNSDEYDVVCCIQSKRIENPITSLFKKMFYKTVSKTISKNFVNGASDYRMMRRNVVETIINMPEKCRFSKGIFAWIGFNTYYLPYDVEPRKYGKSKFNFKRLLNYAFDGIVIFSNSPLYISLKLGIFNVILSILALIALIILKCIYKIDNFLEYLILDSIVLFSGIILMSIGIVGRYLANIYEESKNRPKYIIRELLSNERED